MNYKRTNNLCYKNRKTFVTLKALIFFRFMFTKHFLLGIVSTIYPV